jgi:hypothetical protein
MMDNYHEQLKGMFIGREAPEFKVRRFLLKSGKERTQVLIIQSEANKANEIMRQFDDVNEINPYEYISWKNWVGFHQSNKLITSTWKTIV